MTGSFISLKRDTKAIAIPSGTEITLYAGTEVRITQALGGNFTVVTHQSAMASIQGKDADALGEEIPLAAKEADEPMAEGSEGIEKQVWKKLKTCYDPEIPHNIVDLGLIYECKVSPLAEPSSYRVEIKMTLTAPGCGMGEVLKQEAVQKIKSIQGVKECLIDLVFEPAWNPGKMNPALRREFF